MTIPVDISPLDLDLFWKHNLNDDDRTMQSDGAEPLVDRDRDRDRDRVRDSDRVRVRDRDREPRFVRAAA